MIDPQTTYIEPTVTIGPDTVIWPNTILRGQTAIGRGCHLGPNALIEDSVIGDRCRVVASVVERAVMEEGSDVGPFSHLRPGAHLGPGAHVGNFGEVKNAYLGPGAKMGHFSYVGDARVGAGANIGAGTVTCNFDGRQKAPDGDRRGGVHRLRHHAGRAGAGGAPGRGRCGPRGDPRHPRRHSGLRGSGTGAQKDVGATPAVVPHRGYPPEDKWTVHPGPAWPAPFCWSFCMACWRGCGRRSPAPGAGGSARWPMRASRAPRWPSGWRRIPAACWAPSTWARRSWPRWRRPWRPSPWPPRWPVPWPPGGSPTPGRTGPPCWWSSAAYRPSSWSRAGWCRRASPPPVRKPGPSASPDPSGS